MSDLDVGERRTGYEDIMKSRFEYMHGCPQCEAETIREQLQGSLRPYGVGIRLACLTVLQHPHECGKERDE